MRCTPNVDNHRTWFVAARRDEVDAIETFKWDVEVKKLTNDDVPKCSRSVVRRVSSTSSFLV